jgi:hypothetical protein
MARSVANLTRQQKSAEVGVLASGGARRRLTD